MTTATTEVRTDGWPLAEPATDFVLGHVRAVLPDRVLDDARVVVRDGMIEAVEPHPSGSGADLDGGGLLVFPGLVDSHSDALELERLPRPTAPLPWEFALESFEAKLRAAGVTTIFHGANFRTTFVRGEEQSIAEAVALASLIDSRSGGAVDHRVLHRLDVYSVEGREALAARLAERPGGAGGDDLPLVSYEDHTPGRGQYADPEYLVRYIAGSTGVSRAEAEAEVAKRRREAIEQEPIRQAALEWVTEQSRAGRIRLLGHDPDTVETVDDIASRGARIAEFPTTLTAARHARERGLLTVAGAPNLMRGESHSGNVSARELVELGLLDALASDYLPSALLGSVSVAARSVGLPATVGLVTSGPAAVAGLDDRGVLAPGTRADLVLVDDSRGPWLRVVQTMRGCAG